MVARAGAGAAGEATLQGLRAAANYSVTVRARADRGLGPPSPPVYCATREDGKMKFEYIQVLTLRVNFQSKVYRSCQLFFTPLLWYGTGITG